MSFPKYEVYKESGVEWLGEVPDHWELKQAKYVFVLQRGHDLSSDHMKEGKYPVFGSNGVIGFHNVCTTLAPNITVGRSGSVGLINYVNEDFWAHNTALFVKNFWSYHPRFTFYLLLAINPSKLASGSAVGTLDRNNIHAQVVAAPLYSEATQIARFLDHETARIDALIAEQQRLIELLKEKRQAVISHAVTKGLDPTAPMKDSGVEWLGEVPAHWKIVRVKHVIQSFEQGWSPQCDNVPIENDEEWGVLKVGCVNGGIFSPKENKRLPDNLEPIPELFLKAGDVLISRANTRELVGNAALVDSDQPNLMLSDKLFRLRTTGDTLPKYLVFYLGTSAVRYQIELDATGASSSMLNIGQAIIKELPIPVPPVNEQQDIETRLEASLNDLYLLQKEAQLTQKLLQERRSALISAAVTGKIDVRGWQAPASAAPVPTLEPAHG